MKPTFIALLALCLCVAGCETTPSDTASLRASPAKILTALGQQAEAGNAIAQYNMALRLDARGNHADAVILYQKAAAQKLREAEYNVGYMYGHGEGLPQNDVNAAIWYHKAAEQGLAVAQHMMGFLYTEGRGVPESFAKAIDWHRKAAEQGLPDAQAHLGYLYATGKIAKRNPTEAAKWFLRAAENGQVAAQFQIGVFLTRGVGVDRDMVEGCKWLNIASQKNHQGAVKARTILLKQMSDDQIAKAQSLSDDFIKKGDSVFRQKPKLVAGGFHKPGYTFPSRTELEAALRKDLQPLRALAEKGNAKAQYELGVIYANGQRAVKDYKEAEKWLRKAAEQGNVDAAINLGDLYKEGGVGVLQDDKEAKRWWEKAVDGYREAAIKGDVKAQTLLGKMYLDGEKIKLDPLAAYAWYNIAAYHGDTVSAQMRDRIIKKGIRANFGRRFMTRSQILEAQKLSRQILAQIEGRKTGKPPIDPEKFPAPKIDPETGLPIRAKQN